MPLRDTFLEKPWMDSTEDFFGYLLLSGSGPQRDPQSGVSTPSVAGQSTADGVQELWG